MINSFQMRAASASDSNQLLALFSEPLVYEYLCDGVPPKINAINDWIFEAGGSPQPFGLWVLLSVDKQLSGCVRLSPVDDDSASAEITYALHPNLWGKGFATSMCRSIMSLAFSHEQCESILAGADSPNSRSFGVMHRLGMQLLHEVEYPAGPGREFLITRSQFLSLEPAETIPLFVE